MTVYKYEVNGSQQQYVEVCAKSKLNGSNPPGDLRGVVGEKPSEFFLLCSINTYTFYVYYVFEWYKTACIFFSSDTETDCEQTF